MKRSSPLRSYARLRSHKPMRRTWMRRKSPRRIARETPAEREHKQLVREMRVCCVAKYAGAGRCSGGLQVAHLGAARGMGLKHGDWTETSLMCSRHHDALDNGGHPFRDMPPEELTAWKDREIALAREFVAGRQAVAA